MSRAGGYIITGTIEGMVRIEEIDVMLFSHRAAILSSISSHIVCRAYAAI